MLPLALAFAFAFAFAFALVFAPACKREPPGAAARVDAAAVVDAADAVVDADAAVLGDAAMPADAAAQAPADATVGPEPEPPKDPHARRVKSIGHTSVVFKIELTSGQKLVFKPHSRRGPGRYKGEIAAYRLARALGLDAVPPAFAATFSHAELAAAAATDEKATQLLDGEVLAESGMVKGALIPWIDDYEVLPLEKEPMFSEVRGWLKKGAAIPADKIDLARATSTLIAFDYVTGNWDRWSGANVATSKSRILYVDNDGAFFEAPPKDALTRNQRLLDATDRFSRSLVERLATAPVEAIGAEAQLSPRAIAGARERLAALRALVARKVATNGEAATLFFP